MKKAFASITITAVLVSALAGFYFVKPSDANFFPDPGPDLQRIYIRIDGSIDPANSPIERTGNLYKLTEDIILKTIEVQRDDIVFDGSGRLIRGNESWMGTTPHFNDFGNNGIVITGRNNVTITKLAIAGFTAGIRVSNSTRVSIVGNQFTNETAPMGDPAGIVVKDSSMVLVENNSFNTKGQSIVCYGDNNEIKNNILIGGGIDLAGSLNLISENEIEASNPLTMDLAESNTIARNMISGFSLSVGSGSSSRTGAEGLVLFRNCSNNQIIGNRVTGFGGQAIRTVWNCVNNTFFGNYLASNNFAVVLQDGAVDNQFYGNAFTLDSCKIQIDDAVVGTRWDNGTIGNFWGDYNGTDSTGDGVGDLPYMVNGFKWDINVSTFVSRFSGQDNYPLMEPSLIPVPTISTTTPIATPSSSTHQSTLEPSASPSETPPWILPYMESERTRGIAIRNTAITLIAAIAAVLVVVAFLRRNRRKREPN